MKENLEEMNSRGVAASWPVLLGGAALTRAYVEDDLAELYEGEVRYARDAFEGLRLMDAVAMAGQAASSAWRRAARAAQAPGPGQGRTEIDEPRRPDTGPLGRRHRQQRPDAAVLGDPGRQGHRAGRLRVVPRRAGDVPRPVGPARAPAADGPSYEELVETEGRPRLRMWLDRIQTEQLLEAAVVYGYFPCVSEGNDLVVLHDEGPQAGQERARFTLPAPAPRPAPVPGRLLPRRDEQAGETDVVAFQLVTMGATVAEATAELFAANAYRDYLELHGLSVQLTEALAELWHARVREELGFGARRRRVDLDAILRPGLPRLALLLRLPGLPRPRGPAPCWSSCWTPRASA